MANTRINTTELLSLLDITPADQNVMLVGNHGIGKSEILTEYFSRKGMKVVPLFLGQMSDPGDLIGIPNRNTETGKTEFMPPYWFPLDGKPIVLFLDELNRARPEVLQTIMKNATERVIDNWWNWHWHSRNHSCRSCQLMKSALMTSKGLTSHRCIFMKACRAPHLVMHMNYAGRLFRTVTQTLTTRSYCLRHATF